MRRQPQRQDALRLRSAGEDAGPARNPGACAVRGGGRELRCARATPNMTQVVPKWTHAAVFATCVACGRARNDTAGPAASARASADAASLAEVERVEELIGHLVVDRDLGASLGYSADFFQTAGTPGAPLLDRHCGTSWPFPSDSGLVLDRDGVVWRYTHVAGPLQRLKEPRASRVGTLESRTFAAVEALVPLAAASRLLEVEGSHYKDGGSCIEKMWENPTRQSTLWSVSSLRREERDSDAGRSLADFLDRLDRTVARFDYTVYDDWPPPRFKITPPAPGGDAACRRARLAAARAEIGRAAAEFKSCKREGTAAVVRATQRDVRSVARAVVRRLVARHDCASARGAAGALATLGEEDASLRAAVTRCGP